MKKTNKYTYQITGKNNHRLPFVFVLLSLILLFNAAHAYEKTKRHFLWSVESKKNTIYLIGSIHMMKKDSYPLPEAIENIYGCCKKVVFETDLDGMSSPESQTKMIKRGVYPTGQALSQNISPQTYNLLERKLDKAGLPIVLFERFKPWFVALSITAMEIQRLGFDPDLGIDRYFFNKAKRDKKEMIFLETNEFQLNLMANLGRPQQELFLRETLRELEIIESMASDMVSSWRTGDVDKLNSIIKLSLGEHPDIYRRFFIQRNRRWASKIKHLMKQADDVLIIVGSGHLVGEESLLELLRKQGYEVKQR
jgi:uncharacterized protein YbaP (TraB family)